MKSRDHQRSAHDRHINPTLGLLPARELKRSHIAKLLDHIEDNSGPVAADRTLAYLRAALNWHSTRVDDFNPPFVRRMRRAPDAPRTRVLTDAEIKRIWMATSDGAPFSRFIRVVLLSGQRRSEVANMSRDEFEGKTWVIPALRYKAAMDHIVPLTSGMLREIGRRERRGPFVFSHTGGATPINCCGKSLSRLHRASRTAGWSCHDLRRTCRTRLAALGVDDGVADLVLGHGKRGMARVYNQYRYESEVRTALEAWSDRVAQIAGQPRLILNTR